MNNKIASISTLQSIPCKENGELLVNLNGSNTSIRAEYRRKDAGLEEILVRQSVQGKLERVQEQLERYDSLLQLLVVEGYRRPAYQEAYFIKELLHQYRLNPTWEFHLLIEHTHQLVALPSVAGHPTGGAVDLTLSYSGEEVDMGGNIADFCAPKLLPTYSRFITPEQAKCRLLLHDMMMAEGFAPFYGEWWHFSYGDREWAAFYDQPEAIYSTRLLI